MKLMSFSMLGLFSGLALAHAETKHGTWKEDCTGGYRRFGRRPVPADEGSGRDWPSLLILPGTPDGSLESRRSTRSTWMAQRLRNLSNASGKAFGKDEDVATLFLEDNAYQITYRGAKPLAAARYSRYVDSTRRNIFYILRERLREPGLILEHREFTSGPTSRLRLWILPTRTTRRSTVVFPEIDRLTRETGVLQAQSG